MSEMSVSAIITRIKDAHEDSPIAVFKLMNKPGYLNAVFASTVKTSAMIRDPRFSERLVGVYDRSFNVESLRVHLQKEAMR